MKTLILLLLSINLAHSIEKPIEQDLVEELIKPVLPKNIAGTWVATGGTNEKTVKSFFKITIYGILEVFNYQDSNSCYERFIYKISSLENNKYRIFYHSPVDVTLLVENGELQKTVINSKKIESNNTYPLLDVSKRTSFKLCQ